MTRSRDLARAVFLDRDGVLNANVLREGKLVSPRTIEDFRLLTGADSAVSKLKSAGFRIVVVTNQPDLRTGHLSREILGSMHAELRRRLALDDIKVCPHIDADLCACRKPKPGMILTAAAELNIDVRRSYLVGDRWRDTLAGRAAGCFTLFVDDGKPQEMSHEADRAVASLREAVDYILLHSASAA